VSNMKPATTPANPVSATGAAQGAPGKHVPSSVPGAGPVDHSAAVGSNVDPGPAGAQRQASQEILDTPPWQNMAPSMTPYVPLG
jgi:hypothetical protein